MRPRLAIGLAALLAAPACASILGVDDVGYGTDGSTGPDGALADVATADVGSEASADDAGIAEGGQPIPCDGSCVLLRIDGGGPRGLAVDGQGYLWVAFLQAGEIWTVRTDGTEARRVWSGGEQPQEIAVDDTYVAWTTQSHVFSKRKDGGNVSNVPVTYPKQIAVVKGVAYFADDATSNGNVYAMTLSTNAPNPIVQNMNTVEGLVVANDQVFFSGHLPSGWIRRVNVDGGDPRTASATLPGRLTADTSNVYALSDSDAGILAVPQSFAGATPIASAVESPRDIAASPSWLYMVSGSANDLVLRYPKSPGAVTTLPVGCAGPQRVAAQPDAVYLTCLNSGTVVKLVTP